MRRSPRRCYTHSLNAVYVYSAATGRLAEKELSMRIRFILPLTLFALLGGVAASAHTTLNHSDPPAGGTVAAAPDEVALTFTESLEPTFSTVQVIDEGGARVDQGKALVNGNMMRVGLKVLGFGSYKVHWHAVSADTHATDGNFSFNVRSP
jgi:copper resistance protein C